MYNTEYVDTCCGIKDSSSYRLLIIDISFDSTCTSDPVGEILAYLLGESTVEIEMVGEKSSFLGGLG